MERHQRPPGDLGSPKHMLPRDRWILAILLTIALAEPASAHTPYMPPWKTATSYSASLGIGLFVFIWLRRFGHPFVAAAIATMVAGIFACAGLAISALSSF